MPIVLLRGSPTVVVPFYVDLPYAIANPFALADIVSPCVGGTIQELTARQAGLAVHSLALRDELAAQARTLCRCVHT